MAVQPAASTGVGEGVGEGAGAGLGAIVGGIGVFGPMFAVLQSQRPSPVGSQSRRARPGQSRAKAVLAAPRSPPAAEQLVAAALAPAP